MKEQLLKNTAMAAALMAVLIAFALYIPAGVFAGSNLPVTVDITVTYIVNGNAKTAGGDTVTLTADDPSSPMPGGTESGKKTITIKDEGTYSFGDIHYEKPGVHWYTVKRDLTKKKGVTKDSPLYKAKVVALNDGHGYVLVYKDGSNEKSELVYTDKVAPETGDNSRWPVYCITFLTAAISLALIVALKARNGRKEVQNDSK